MFDTSAIDTSATLLEPTSQLRHRASCKTKRKLLAANSKQRRFVYTRSLKYHLVVIKSSQVKSSKFYVMSGARIDVVEASI